MKFSRLSGPETLVLASEPDSPDRIGAPEITCLGNFRWGASHVNETRGEMCARGFHVPVKIKE